jgi:hypothetical protein
MTACTERHSRNLPTHAAGEGQKGMPSQHSMTACTERHSRNLPTHAAGEGQKGILEGGTA